MTSLRKFEKQAIKILINEKNHNDILEPILNLNTYQFDYTGAGYSLTIKDSQLGFQRSVYSEPIVSGTYSGSIRCGFVVFIEENTLTLECHPYEENLIENFRENKIELQVKHD